MSAPVLAFRTPKRQQPAPAHPVVGKVERLARVRPLAVKLIERIVDDLLTEYDAAPGNWPGSGKAGA